MKTEREWDIAILEARLRNRMLIEKYKIERAGNRHGNVQSAGRGQPVEDSGAVRGFGIGNSQGERNQQPEYDPAGPETQYPE